MKRAILWAAATVLGWVVPAEAGVLVVDAAAGPFTDIQPAVNAAVDGDVILVRAGFYSGFAVANKALTIAAHPTAGFDDVKVSGTVRVLGLAAGKTVQMTFLTVAAKSQSSPSDPLVTALELSQCQGAVRLEACRFTGAHGKLSIAGGAAHPAARVTQSADVLFLGCQLQGGFADHEACNDPAAVGGRGGDGLVVAQSGVALYDSVVWGGGGGEACHQGGDGGDGGSFTAAEVYASNVQWRGGNGASAVEFFCIPSLVGGNGGAGIVLDPLTIVRLLGGSLVPGNGGKPFFCSQAGSPGPMTDGGGTPQALPGTPRSFNLTKSASEGQTVLLQFLGASGENVYLFLAPSTSAATYLDAFLGVYALGNPLVGPFPAGTLPAGGVLQYSVALPQLPPSVLGLGLYAQPFFVAPSGAAQIGSLAHLTIFDASL